MTKTVKTDEREAFAQAHALANAIDAAMLAASPAPRSHHQDMS